MTNWSLFMFSIAMINYLKNIFDAKKHKYMRKKWVHVEPREGVSSDVGGKPTPPKTSEDIQTAAGRNIISNSLEV